MFTLNTLATKFGAILYGDADYTIDSLQPIEQATTHSISFLSNKKYINHLSQNKIGAILISEELYFELQPLQHQTIEGGFLVVKNAYALVPQLLALFYTNKIVREAIIGKNTKLYTNVYLGNNVQLGDNCIIYPNVVIYDDVIIGNNVIIHAGAVIGADGFGFAPQTDGTFKKIPQFGSVIIEDDCEIGANTCIDRGTIGATILRKGVKLDNLIQVGHNVEIGEHTVIAAQTGISGSTKIGHHCMVGGQVGFVGHLIIAPYTKINAQSGVAQTVKEEHTILGGSPAFDLQQFFKSSVLFKKLPEWQRRLNFLEQKLSKIQSTRDNED